MANYIIPLTPEPQSFGISLAGRELRLTVRWHETTEGGWLLDIHEPERVAPIVCGIPLVTGCDLLEQYEYLGLSGALYVAAPNDLPADLDNLGETVQVVFATEGA